MVTTVVYARSPPRRSRTSPGVRAEPAAWSTASAAASSSPAARREAPFSCPNEWLPVVMTSKARRRFGVSAAICTVAELAAPRTDELRGSDRLAALFGGVAALDPVAGRVERRPQARGGRVEPAAHVDLV